MARDPAISLSLRTADRSLAAQAEAGTALRPRQVGSRFSGWLASYSPIAAASCRTTTVTTARRRFRARPELVSWDQRPAAHVAMSLRAGRCLPGSLVSGTEPFRSACGRTPRRSRLISRPPAPSAVKRVDADMPARGTVRLGARRTPAQFPIGPDSGRCCARTGGPRAGPLPVPTCFRP